MEQKLISTRRRESLNKILALPLPCLALPLPLPLPLSHAKAACLDDVKELTARTI